MFATPKLIMLLRWNEMEKKMMYIAVGVVAIVILAAVGAALVLNNGSSNPEKEAKIVLLKKTSTSPAYNPLDQAAVYNGSYSLARFLYLYTDGIPNSTSSLYKWLSYVLNSTTGQQQVLDSGFYPLQTTDLNAMRLQLTHGNTDSLTGRLQGGWIDDNGGAQQPMDDWIQDRDWNIGHNFIGGIGHRHREFHQPCR